MDYTDEHIERGVAVLVAGQALVFPTDTLYGLGVAVGIAESPAVLYEIKERDQGKPVAWLVGSPDSLHLYAHYVPEFAMVLARTFWPGPLTLIVRAGTNVRGPFRAEDDTIALRMPDNEIALELIKRVGMPIATTSANISGQKPPKSFEELDPALLERVPVVLRDDGEKTGLASTIVNCTDERPVVIREGNISIADIEAVV